MAVEAMVAAPTGKRWLEHPSVGVMPHDEDDATTRTSPSGEDSTWGRTPRSDASDAAGP